MSEVSIRVLPAWAGIVWLRDGLRIFWRRPLMLLVLVLPVLVLALAMMQTLFLQALWLLLVPALMLGLLAMCRVVDGGGVPGVACYVEGLRDARGRLRLLQVGICYALATGLVSTLLSLVPEAGAETSAWKLLAALAVMLPVLYVTFFATVLVGWHGMGTPKALFFGLFAVWRNRLAIVMNLLASAGLNLLILLTLAAAVSLLGTDDTARDSLLAAILMLLFLPITSASIYRMVHEVIAVRDAPAPGEAPAAG